MRKIYYEIVNRNDCKEAKLYADEIAVEDDNGYKWSITKNEKDLCSCGKRSNFKISESGFTQGYLCEHCMTDMIKSDKNMFSDYIILQKNEENELRIK